MNLAYLRHALGAAWRLARFNSSALQEFDNSFGGFFRSFYALLVCAPLYAVLLLGQRKVEFALLAEAPAGDVPLPPPAPLSLPLESVIYAVNWLALPVAMILVARLIGAGARYVPFIVAYNWGTWIVFLAMVLPFSFYLMGGLPLVPTLVLYYPAAIFGLVYRWRIARDALQVSGLTAAGIVILDVLLGIFIALAAAGLRDAVSA